MRLGVWPVVTLLLARVFAGAGDWPQWRGPSRDGVVPGLEGRSWKEAPRLRWKTAVGPGYASPVVSGSTVYVFTRTGEDEVLSALDLGTGRVRWRQRDHWRADRDAVLRLRAGNARLARRSWRSTADTRSTPAGTAWQRCTGLRPPQSTAIVF